MKQNFCRLLFSPVLLIGLWSCPTLAHDMSPEEKMYLLGVVADRGDAAAHFNMAYEFAVGNDIDAVGAGTPKDPEKALALFHDAADLGNPGAQLLLSYYYDEGFGVKADKAQAYKWALLAVTHGSPVAKQVLPDFEKTLTPEQHAEGQRLAKAWEVTTFEAHEAKYGQAHHQGQAPPPQHGHGHPGMERYRIEVGSEHGVEVANIVGAITNEAGIDSQYIGTVRIKEDHSLIELPEGMPKAIFEDLEKAWVCGQKLQISKVGGKETGYLMGSHNSDKRDKPPRSTDHSANPGSTTPHNGSTPPEGEDDKPRKILKTKSDGKKPKRAGKHGKKDTGGAKKRPAPTAE